MDAIAYFLQRTIAQALPLLFGSTGEILTEKSGNLNLGIPGIMVAGGVAGMISATVYEKTAANPIGIVSVCISFLFAILCAGLVSLIYCFLTVTLRANQNVTGLAITIFGTGFGNFFGGAIGKLMGINDISILMTVDTYKKTLPFAKNLGWFGTIFLEHGFLFYLSIIIAVLAAYILKHTRTGLNLRAVGENPATADAAGISVTKYKYLATCIGGSIAGLGGLYYVMDYSRGTWDTQSFGERGWLSIALVIFVIWNPDLAILGATLFGGLYIADVYVPGLSGAQKELFKMLPYVVTILVLILTSRTKKKKNQPPESLGIPYFREDR